MVESIIVLIQVNIYTVFRAEIRAEMPEYTCLSE